MTSFNYVGSGGVMVGGCANVTKAIYVIYKWGEGSVVFNVHKAARGVMEAVAIKEVRLINNKKTFAKTVAMYIDTYNGLWNEYELVSEDDARAIASDFLATQLAEYRISTLKCSARTQPTP